MNSAPSFTIATGTAVTPVGTGEDGAYSMTVQPDGKILLAGYTLSGSDYDFALVRYNADGTLDTTFSGDGKVTTTFSPRDIGRSVAVQVDGKILVGGLSGGLSDPAHYALARYLPDGTLDTTFSGDGKASTPTGAFSPARSIAVQADGRIVVIGETPFATVVGSEFTLLRYNADGTVDGTFDGDGNATTGGFGYVNNVPKGLVIQADGKIVVAGSTGMNDGVYSDIALARYNTDGSLDTTFDSDGRVTTNAGFFETAETLAIQTDGKILTAGAIVNNGTSDFIIARYLANGSLDTGFGTGGLVRIDFGSSESAANITVGADGKIMVVGDASSNGVRRFAVARLNGDGSLDASFSDDGKLTALIPGDAVSNVWSTAVRPDGKILLSGNSAFDFALTRFNADGTPDTTFAPTSSISGIVSFVEDTGGALLDGSITVRDSELDALNGGAGNYAGASVVLSRHGGASTADVFGIATGGALFAAAGNALQSGGQTFATYSQSGGALTITFTSSGTPATNALVENVLEHVTYSNVSNAPPASVQIDWRLSDGNTGNQGSGGALSVVGGTTVTILAVDDGNTAPQFITHAPGIVTTPFGSFVAPAEASTSTVPNWLSFAITEDLRRDAAHSVVVQADGRIVAVGSHSIGGVDFALARYNIDGTLDRSFSGDGMTTTAFGARAEYARDVVLQPDGKILVAGETENGSASGIALASVGGGSRSDWDIALARYNADGTLDTTFSGDGKLATTFGLNSDYGRSVLLQSDGRIVVAGSSGSNFAVLRYTADGTLDSSFSNGGTTTDIGTNTADSATSAALQSDGKIVVVGSTSNGSESEIAVVRYNVNGTLDTTFSGDGKVTTPVPTSTGISEGHGDAVALQQDGKIVVAGTGYEGPNSDFVLLRYNADGSLDFSFSDDGRVRTEIGSGSDFVSAVAVQADGKIVVLGTTWTGADYDIALVRYNSNGSLDSGFGSGGRVVTAVSSSNDTAHDVTLTADGKIVVVGESYKADQPHIDSDFLVIRYNSDGSLDTSFDAAPTVAPAAGYVRGGPPVTLGSGIFLSDRDLDVLNAGAGDYAGASVTISRHGGADAADVFGFAASTAFTISGGTLRANGAAFASFSQAAGVFTISFTSAGTTATQALALDVLQHVTYAQSAAAASLPVRIDWTFSDGNTGGQGAGGALSALASSVVTIETANAAPTVDLNADGKSDVVWRSTDGTVVVWQMNGAQPTSTVVAGGPVPTSWSIVDAHGDYNGDGRSDVLWRNADGAVVIWQMDGAQPTSSVVAGGPVPLTWNIVDGHGDYNGDGKSDVLWRNSDGAVVIWQMDGSQPTSSVVAGGAVPLNWSIVNAHGDFNGDGRSDVLWRNTSDGTVVTWQMNGAQATSTVVGGAPVPLTWSIVDSQGDYNGDGKTDILWRNTSDGTVVTWQMNGAQVTSTAVGGAPVPLSWNIIDGHGDYNGDGKSDILWRNSDGTVVTWQMNGTQVTSNVVGGAPVPMSWTIVDGHADYNADGKSDILWRNSDGTVVTWQMNGTQVTSNVVGGGAVPLTWAITDAAEIGGTFIGDHVNNNLAGTDGRDTLYGKLGNDILTGNAGADRYVFDTTPSSSTNADTVNGFVSGSDKLLLSQLIYSSLSQGPLQAQNFVAEPGAAAHDANDFILYNTSTGAVSYDADGAGANAAVVFAMLANHPLLVAPDIHVGVI